MKYLKQSFLFTVLSFLLVAGVSLASAWIGPTAEPPGNNASAPINVSSVSQIKTGALTVGGFSLVDGTQGAGKFLTSDSDGKASWVNAGGGGNVGGSGTANYVPKWTSSSSLGNSQIFDDGAGVGIGTNAPQAKLHLKAGNKQKDPYAFRMEQGINIKAGDVLTSADVYGNAQWEPQYRFGGIYNKNIDGSCRWGNPYTGGACSCPGGFSPAQFDDFMNESCLNGRYSDNWRKQNCGIQIYQCVK